MTSAPTKIISEDQGARKDIEAMAQAKKEPGYMKLAICFAGIFVSYFIYGILQEKM